MKLERINGSHLIFDTASFACNIAISNNPRWCVVRFSKTQNHCVEI